MKVDITHRSYCMPRNSAICYRRDLKGWTDDPPPFSGRITLDDGRELYINLWPERIVKGKDVFEVRLKPIIKEEG